MKRIVVDASRTSAAGQPTGSARVLLECADHLSRTGAPFDVRVATRSPASLGEFATRFDIVENLDSANLVWRPHQILREADLRSVFSGPWRVVLHHLDTFTSDFPSYYPSTYHFHSALNVQLASIQSSDVVTTISEFTARSVQRFCPPLEPRRLRVVGCGADHDLRGPSDRPPRIPVATSFVAVIGAAFGHKNRPFAISVFFRMVDQGYQGLLVLAGPTTMTGNSLADEAAILRSRPEYADRVIDLGAVPDSERNWLYANAECVLFPSLSEGFGLGPFEAAAHGTPCLAARLECTEALFTPRVKLARGFDVDDWSNLILTWIRHPSAAGQQVDALQDSARQHRWLDTALRLEDAFHTAFEMPSARPYQIGPRRLHSLARPGRSAPARAVDVGVRAASLARRTASTLLRRASSL